MDLANDYLTAEQMKMPVGRRIKTMHRLGWNQGLPPVGERVIGLNVNANVLRAATAVTTERGGQISYDDRGIFFHLQLWAREPIPINTAVEPP